MRKLRYWVTGMCLWLFFFYNLERLGQRLNIASFVYVYTALWIVLLVALWPQLRKIPLPWLFTVVLTFYVLLKFFFGYNLGGAALAITVTEVAALWITIGLSLHISNNLVEIEETISDLVIGRTVQEIEQFDDGQWRIYSEIRRARLYERPASVLAIAVTPNSARKSFKRFSHEVQQNITDRYIEARTAHLLVEELNDCDIITQKDGHFITLLPEISERDLAQIVERLKTAAQDRLGLQFAVGFATFPDESVTFESLVTLAEARLQQGEPAVPARLRQALSGRNESERSKEPQHSIPA